MPILHLFYSIFIILSMTLATTSYAYQQNTKLWVGLTTTQALTADGRWKYLIFSQARYVNESLPWQSVLLEGAIGKEINKDSTIWLGYRFTERNPAAGFNPENRLFQQYITRFAYNDKFEWIYRGRLEETQRKGQNQIALRLRNRLTFGFREPLFLRFLPMFYDEIFLQLNQTSWTPHYVVSENRLFIGGNWSYSNTSWLEIGYLNQYHMRLPQQAQNTMSHVISAVYYF